MSCITIDLNKGFKSQRWQRWNECPRNTSLRCSHRRQCIQLLLVLVQDCQPHTLPPTKLSESFLRISDKNLELLGYTCEFLLMFLKTSLTYLTIISLSLNQLLVNFKPNIESQRKLWNFKISVEINPTVGLQQKSTLKAGTPQNYLNKKPYKFAGKFLAPYFVLRWLTNAWMCCRCISSSCYFDKEEDSLYTHMEAISICSLTDLYSQWNSNLVMSFKPAKNYAEKNQTKQKELHLQYAWLHTFSGGIL